MSTELVRPRHLDSEIRFLCTGAHMLALIRSRGRVFSAAESSDFHFHQRTLWSVLPVFYTRSAYLKTLITRTRV